MRSSSSLASCSAFGRVSCRLASSSSPVQAAATAASRRADRPSGSESGSVAASSENSASRRRAMARPASSSRRSREAIAAAAAICCSAVSTTVSWVFQTLTISLMQVRTVCSAPSVRPARSAGRMPRCVSGLCSNASSSSMVRASTRALSPRMARARSTRSVRMPYQCQASARALSAAVARWWVLPVSRSGTSRARSGAFSSSIRTAAWEATASDSRARVRSIRSWIMLAMVTDPDIPVPVDRTSVRRTTAGSLSSWSPGCS